MQYYKGYKIRLYPTKNQEELMWKHIHACRFIYNYMVDLQTNNYKNNGKYIKKFDMIKLLTPLKQQDEYKWLYEVSNTSLQITCQDVDKAFVKFFKKQCNYPCFKSKKDRHWTYPVSTICFHFNDDKTVTIQKLTKVKIKQNFIPNGKIINPRITFVNNKWILSLSVLCEKQVLNTKTKQPLGIDVGIKELAVVAYNNQCFTYHNINKSKRVQTLKHKLKYIDKVIARKYRVNNNYNATKQIIKYQQIRQQIYYKLHNIRLNYLHQVTHDIIMLNPSDIIIEDLKITNMMKNRCLSSAISEQCLYEFYRQLQYKCDWNNINISKANMFYPSSKLCSCCGNKKHDLKLSDRIYKCDKCGLIIDRDYNAAINLMHYEGHINHH